MPYPTIIYCLRTTPEIEATTRKHSLFVNPHILSAFPAFSLYSRCPLSLRGIRCSMFPPPDHQFHPPSHIWHVPIVHGMCITKTTPHHLPYISQNRVLLYISVCRTSATLFCLILHCLPSIIHPTLALDAHSIRVIICSTPPAGTCSARILRSLTPLPLRLIAALAIWKTKPWIALLVCASPSPHHHSSLRLPFPLCLRASAGGEQRNTRVRMILVPPPPPPPRRKQGS